MPLTPFQSTLAKLLSANRSPDSYLAGGAALHIQPQSRRYSADLDYFHDSVERTARAFNDDRILLESSGYAVAVDMTQPGYIRAIVNKDGESTKVEWAHDSSWRFLPPLKDDNIGFTLHAVDLAINKILALVGRDEPRDYLDVLDAHESILPLGALLWAAAGKDPGFTPLSLLDLARRRGRYRPEEFARLHLNVPVDLIELKKRWLDALENGEAFIRGRPPAEIGCLYYSPSLRQFVAPHGADSDAVPHYGRPGGILPAF